MVLLQSHPEIHRAEGRTSSNVAKRRRWWRETTWELNEQGEALRYIETSYSYGH
jgi:hypothetical protein